MELFENMFQTLCRICLKMSKNDEMVPLIHENKITWYGQSMLTFTNISLDNNVFPLKMCRKCLFRLKEASKFKRTCETSHKMLNDMCQKHPKNFKQLIINYSIVNEHLPELWPNKIIPKKHHKDQTCLINKQTDELMQINCKKSFSDVDSNNSDFDDNISIKDDSDQDCIVNVSYKSENKEQIENSLKIKDKSILKTKKNIKKCTNSNLSKTYPKQVNSTKEKKNRKYICKICQKQLSCRTSYVNHKQIHEGFRFVCEHCGRGFAYKAGLNAHRVSVHGTGSYLSCDQCDFKASRKFDLVEHKRIHTGERPHACDKCGLTFRRKYILRKHLMIHSDKNIQCPNCPLKFYSHGAMLAHSNNIHERVYVYVCDICGVTYARNKSVRKHLFGRHGIPREEQGKITRLKKGTVGFPVNELCETESNEQ